jgi:hypothetical protein
MEKKGGETNEKKHITHDQPAAGIDAILGLAAGVRRGTELGRNDFDGSC